MSHLTRGDADLHNADGSHRCTAIAASGHQLALYENRIQRHLAAHAAERKAPMTTLNPGDTVHFNGDPSEYSLGATVCDGIVEAIYSFGPSANAKVRFNRVTVREIDVDLLTVITPMSDERRALIYDEVKDPGSFSNWQLAVANGTTVLSLADWRTQTRRLNAPPTIRYAFRINVDVEAVTYDDAREQLIDAIDEMDLMQFIVTEPVEEPDQPKVAQVFGPGGSMEKHWQADEAGKMLGMDGLIDALVEAQDDDPTGYIAPVEAPRADNQRPTN